jgi:hypothetical protein
MCLSLNVSLRVSRYLCVSIYRDVNQEKGCTLSAHTATTYVYNHSNMHIAVSHSCMYLHLAEQTHTNGQHAAVSHSCMYLHLAEQTYTNGQHAMSG